MQPQAELPSPTLFAMAAAMMHQEGRLFAPYAKENRPGIIDNLKAEEHSMESDQRRFDSNRKENREEEVIPSKATEGNS
jgi:hypothetical protein